MRLLPTLACIVLAVAWFTQPVHAFYPVCTSGSCGIPVATTSYAPSFSPVVSSPVAAAPVRYATTTCTTGCSPAVTCAPVSYSIPSCSPVVYRANCSPVTCAPISCGTIRSYPATCGSTGCGTVGVTIRAVSYSAPVTYSAGCTTGFCPTCR